jgi:SAM-dependent methyltransferase
MGSGAFNGDWPQPNDPKGLHGIFSKLSKLDLTCAGQAESEAAFADFWQCYMGNYAADIPFYERLLPRGPSRVLDLSFGAARIGIALARVGAKVDALIGNDALLALAQGNVAREGEAVRDRLQLHRADICNFAFEQRYDLIVLGGTSISLLADADERLALLRRACFHLKPEGKFICDLMEFGAPDAARQALDVWSFDTDGGRDFAIVGQQFIPEHKRVDFNFYRESIGADGVTTRSMGSRSRVWLAPEELLEAMLESGLHLLNEFASREVRYFVGGPATQH